MNGILNRCRTTERTHLLSVIFSHFSAKWANRPPTGMSESEEQAVERAGLHILAEEEAGLKEGNCRMLPVLLILSFLV